MALNIPLHVVQSNLITLAGQILDSSGDPFDLTDYTLSFVLKASSSATDESGTTITPDVTTATLGKFTVSIPGTDIDTAGTEWYRVDVIDADNNPVTALLGNFSVLAA